MLTINISELLLTVLSFFILMFLLNKLLFKPVISFREQRQKRMDDCYRQESLAKEKLAHRGYNQSEEIARGVAAVTGLPSQASTIFTCAVAGSTSSDRRKRIILFFISRKCFIHIKKPQPPQARIKAVTLYSDMIKKRF